MTTMSRRITSGACAVLACVGIGLGAATAAVASLAEPAPGIVAPAADPSTAQDPTPLVIQTRDYPVTMTVTGGPKAGYQRVIGPREHEVFPTSPNVASRITFTFDEAPHGQTYEIDPNRAMRFDMQGNAQYPAVTLRTS
ncbi:MULTISPECIES: hypothetical protein [unclassified Pseudonocardia]|uniref:hypothetical protein n=1 Tax=unclassified Pseudonocardia TaxID=2619320 RepID=UPI00094AD446|nr:MULTISPECIES: hypothetical protein [unclassified Pseudonocardia]